MHKKMNGRSVKKILKILIAIVGTIASIGLSSVTAENNSYSYHNYRENNDINDITTNEFDSGCLKEFVGKPHEVMIAIDPTEGEETCKKFASIVKSNMIDLLLGASLLTYPANVKSYIVTLDAKCAADEEKTNTSGNFTALTDTNILSDKLSKYGCPVCTGEDAAEGAKKVVPSLTWSNDSVKSIVIVSGNPKATMEDYDFSNNDSETTNVILLSTTMDSKNIFDKVEKAFKKGPKSHHHKSRRFWWFGNNKDSENEDEPEKEDFNGDVKLTFSPAKNLLTGACSNTLQSENTVTLDDVFKTIKSVGKPKTSYFRSRRGDEEGDVDVDNIETSTEPHPGEKYGTLIIMTAIKVLDNDMLFPKFAGNENEYTEEIDYDMHPSGFDEDSTEENENHSDNVKNESAPEFENFEPNHLKIKNKSRVFSLRSDSEGPYPPDHPHYKGPHSEHESHEEHEEHEEEHEEHEEHGEHSGDYSEHEGVVPILVYPQYDPLTNSFVVPQNNGNYVYYNYDDPLVASVINQSFPGLVSASDIIGEQSKHSEESHSEESHSEESHSEEAQGEESQVEVYSEEAANEAVNETPEIAEPMNNEVLVPEYTYYEPASTLNELNIGIEGLPGTMGDTSVQTGTVINAEEMEQNIPIAPVVPVESASISSNVYSPVESELQSGVNAPAVSVEQGSTTEENEILDENADENVGKNVYIIPGVSAITIVSCAAAAMYFYRRRTNRNATRQVNSGGEVVNNRINPLYNPPVSQISNPLYINPGSNIY